VKCGGPLRKAKETPPKYKMHQLIECSQFDGINIHGRMRELMGSIARIFIESDNARVSYVLAKFDLLGLGDEYFPIPWMALKYNPRISGYQTHLIKRQLIAAPRYPASTDFNYKKVGD